jgi:hypothetical protein
MVGTLLLQPRLEAGDSRHLQDGVGLGQDTTVEAGAYFVMVMVIVVVMVMVLMIVIVIVPVTAIVMVNGDGVGLSQNAIVDR